jgi:hypothetical protein
MVKIIKLLGACCFATAVLVSHAFAHGGVSVEGNRCIMRIGPYMMNFSGYQPDTQMYEQFCDDIPDTGRTVIVLDVEQLSGGSATSDVNLNDLRNMAIDFRVLRDIGQVDDKENMEQNTEVYMPPQKYPGGTLHFEHNFPVHGKFIGLVSATDDHGRVFVSRFPFSVGPMYGTTVMIYVVAALLLAGGGAGYYFYTRRKTKG